MKRRFSDQAVGRHPGTQCLCVWLGALSWQGQLPGGHRELQAARPPCDHGEGK